MGYNEKDIVSKTAISLCSRLRYMIFVVHIVNKYRRKNLRDVFQSISEMLDDLHGVGWFYLVIFSSFCHNTPFLQSLQRQ